MSQYPLPRPNNAHYAPLPFVKCPGGRANPSTLPVVAGTDRPAGFYYPERGTPNRVDSIRGCRHDYRQSAPFFPREWAVSEFGGWSSWWPTEYNGGVLVKPLNYCPECNPTFDGVFPWNMRQR